MKKSTKKIDYGKKLVEKIREQRNYFTLTIDRQRIVTRHNAILYHSLEEEIFNLQKLMARENKKKLIADLRKKRNKERGKV